LLQRNTSTSTSTPSIMRTATPPLRSVLLGIAE
jgi:hypothetical protein